MFKDNFTWGAATASYQIEGAAFEDGKGLNIWDTFSHTEGKIYNGHTGDVACDHYHRYKEDVALMKEIGLKAYRFSLSWARILPEGTGKINPKGIEFYNNLINELIDAGIEPYITLYHWDYPQALFEKGGWLNPESPKWFEEYAKTVAENFSDRVKNFITFNEPICFVGLGYVTGSQAPGLKSSPRDVTRIGHNVLIAHGLGVKVLRENARQTIRVGYAPNNSFAYPVDESKQSDIDAARILSWPMKRESHGCAWSPAWWMDPVVFGKYPKELIDLFEEHLPEGWQDDMKTICQPLDFMGMNTYSGYPATTDQDGNPVIPPFPEGFPRTAIGWDVTPEALKWCAIFLYERYKLPVVITENGMSCHDAISLDGKVHDPNRINFLHRYIRALRDATDMGADVDAYFSWSLMDNYEWGNGYKDRFGLIYVDYPTGKRIIKDSGYWYKKVIESNGKDL
ncbi:MAG: GH1 family beta-glucosidase [Eubacteriales bacterium]|nr:GH1 family beta-glucosidase [Eubacteriales bacterium]